MLWRLQMYKQGWQLNQFYWLLNSPEALWLADSWGFASPSEMSWRLCQRETVCQAFCDLQSPARRAEMSWSAPQSSWIRSDRIPGTITLRVSWRRVIIARVPHSQCRESRVSAASLTRLPERTWFLSAGYYVFYRLFPCFGETQYCVSQWPLRSFEQWDDLANEKASLSRVNQSADSIFAQLFHLSKAHPVPEPASLARNQTSISSLPLSL